MSDPTNHEPASLNEALALFQRNLPHVGKDSLADTGKYKYKYVDLTALHELIFPMLADLRLTWVTGTAVREDAFLLRYTLTHVPTGESLGGEWPLPPVSAGSQALGSAVTYARRYALVAVLGLAPGGDDDDGKAASEKKASDPDPAVRASKPPAVATPPQGWRAKLAAVTNLEQMQELFDSEARLWYTDEVKLAFKARKAAIVGAAS